MGKREDVSNAQLEEDLDDDWSVSTTPAETFKTLRHRCCTDELLDAVAEVERSNEDVADESETGEQSTKDEPLEASESVMNRTKSGLFNRVKKKMSLPMKQVQRMWLRWTRRNPLPIPSQNRRLFWDVFSKV